MLFYKPLSLRLLNALNLHRSGSNNDLNILNSEQNRLLSLGLRLEGLDLFEGGSINGEPLRVSVILVA